MDKTDLEVIESLSEPAKKLFYSLDRNSQKRMLKKAKEFAIRNRDKEKIKEKKIKQLQVQNEKQKKQKSKRQSENKGYRPRASTLESATKVADSYKEATVTALGILLLGQSESENGYEETSRSDAYKIVPTQVAQTTSRKAASSMRRSISGAMAKRRQVQQMKRSAQTGAKATKAGAKTTKEAMKKIVSATKDGIVAAATNPIVWVFLLVGLVIMIIGGVISMIVVGAGASESGDSSSYQAQVSDKVEGYRDLVEKYCDKYDIDDYVDLCLAVIQQESSGNPPDVMQTEQSYYNTKPPIDSAEESIDCGTHELADCLAKAKCKSASDMKNIKLALQGYNYGNGYIDWAVKNYGGYSKDNAVIFSQNMCAKLGYKNYGDRDYVPHVLRYYIANPEAQIANESASKLMKELKENNEASDEVWSMIERGASLIGKVEYSMDKRQGDGRDNPTYLDCSSFTGWTFHKSGITNVPYGATTTTFVTSSKFKTISASDLKPGDIGLKNTSTAAGGTNHVGIYCGKLKNGTKVWLHCTSSSSSSLTGNKSGPMFGAYTNFTVFRRLKKWNK